MKIFDSFIFKNWVFKAPAEGAAAGALGGDFVRLVAAFSGFGSDLAALELGFEDGLKALTGPASGARRADGLVRDIFLSIPCQCTA